MSHRILLLLLLAACKTTDAPLDAGPQVDGSTPLDADPIGCPSEPGGEDVVVTQQGAARGVIEGGALMFRGIPYAIPPLGDLRWRPPVPPACFEGTFDATTFGPKCPQLEEGIPIGEEDCLQLNVWSPRNVSNAPVLFFIHGGGNAQGSAVNTVGGELFYDGRTLAEEHQVVVVTINYRLGPLAWLTHPELDAESALDISGNYGTLDQIAALTWVKENIAAFGGDPERVMIFGESAGARNVCVLVASPLAAGLFSAALMQSGGCSVSSTEDVLAVTREQIERSGCESASEGEVACLRSKSPATLLSDNPPVIDVIGMPSHLQPHIDGHVVLGQPDQILREGRHNHVPFIIGANRDETARQVPLMITEAQYEQLVASLLGPLAPQALALYPVSAYGSARAAYVAMTSDAKFICTARRDARAADAGQEEPVYRYFFTQSLSAPMLSRFGAFHGLELFFVFDSLMLGGYQPTAEETALASLLRSYWTTFAGTGDPNRAGAPVWAPYDAAIDDTLVLTGTTSAMADGIRTTECDFWDSLLR
jgi:para-nitrobenzyl esterase